MRYFLMKKLASFRLRKPRMLKIRVSHLKKSLSSLKKVYPEIFRIINLKNLIDNHYFKVARLLNLRLKMAKKFSYKFNKKKRQLKGFRKINVKVKSKLCVFNKLLSLKKTLKVKVPFKKGGKFLRVLKLNNYNSKLIHQKNYLTFGGVDLLNKTLLALRFKLVKKPRALIANRLRKNFVKPYEYCSRNFLNPAEEISRIFKFKGSLKTAIENNYFDSQFVYAADPNIRSFDIVFRSPEPLQLHRRGILDPALAVFGYIKKYTKQEDGMVYGNLVYKVVVNNPKIYGRFYELFDRWEKWNLFLKDSACYKIFKFNPLRKFNFFKLNFVQRSFNTAYFNQLIFSKLSGLSKSSSQYFINVPLVDLNNLNTVRMILLRFFSFEKFNNLSELNWGDLVFSKNYVQRVIKYFYKFFLWDRFLFNSVNKNFLNFSCGFPSEYANIYYYFIEIFNSYTQRVEKKMQKYKFFESRISNRTKRVYTRVYINFNRKNVFFTVANNVGRPFFSCSCGASGAKGKDKVNSYYIYLSSLNVFQKIVSLKRDKFFVYFYLSGFCSRKVLNFIFMNFCKLKLRAVFIKNYTPLPFSKGLRARKPRRL